MTDSTRVLIIDDDPDDASGVGACIAASHSPAKMRTSVDVAGTYDAGLDALGRGTYDVAFIDYGLEGLALLREARRLGIATPAVIMTSQADGDVAIEAMKAGAADYFSKATATPESLAVAIRHALAIRAEERQRRQVEEALRASEERFRALVENGSDALVQTNRAGRITYVTPAWERHLGWKSDQTLGSSILDFFQADDRELGATRLEEAVQRKGEPIVGLLRCRHADGGIRLLEAVWVNRLDEPSVGSIVINLRDVTERHRLEDQLRQSQKIESVGRLAGGIAHDFNNLLTAILGYTSLLLDDTPREDPQRADLEEIRSAGERAAALTRQLLAFSRRQMLQPQVVDINALVAQFEKMLRRLIGEDIDLVTALAPDLASARLDPSSIEQVLANLAVNARDAMPLGGRLTIETSNVELDQAYARSHVNVVPGRYAMLAFSDTGEGMDAATSSMVFEPFFTTKEQGKGSGLGLATVYGIVKQSGGYIWVYSEPGHGTSFKVYFPATDTVEVQSERPLTLDRGWETILLVEDEDAVRELAREVLRRQGYQVLEARHGLDAIRVAEGHGEAIHLMITDVVMPHMSGRDLAERLASARADMKVLFMSGYTDHAVVHRDVNAGSAFLQKPFTPDTFARTVRRVLRE